MKRALKRVTIVGMLLGVAGATTAWGEMLKSVIPFEFQVDGMTLPAGKYELSVDAAKYRATLTPERGTPIFLAAHPNQWKGHQGMGALEFHRYAGVHYLRCWKMPGTLEGYQAPQSRGEKQASKDSPREVALVLVAPK